MQKKLISVTTGAILIFLIAFSPAQSLAKDATTCTKPNESVVALTSSAQQRKGIALLDTLKVTSKTRIIGKHYDHTNVLDLLYSFLLKDSTSIVQFTKSFVAGKKIRDGGTYGPFGILIVNDDLVTKYIFVDPKSGILSFDGCTYSFDSRMIKKIAKTHSLNWEEVNVGFSSKEEADRYIDETKRDSNLLYYYDPSFRFEGSFTMTAKKSRFDSPKAIIEYLTSCADKIAKRDEFCIQYLLAISQVESVIQSDSYTVSVSGTKQLYDNFNVNEFTKGDWNGFGKRTGTFCYRR